MHNYPETVFCFTQVNSSRNFLFPSPNRSTKVSKMNRDKTFARSLVILQVILLIVYAIPLAEARKNHGKKKAHATSRPPAGGNYSRADEANIFDISSFGAKGDGVSDDSKALLAAWKAACKVSGATVKVPSELKFLVKPITLQGPCMPRLTLQIDGTLLAPRRGGSWPKSSLFQWINFKWVRNFTIQGTGIVDGQGFDWWTTADSESDVKLQKKKFRSTSSLKPTALRFYSSYNVTVRGITITNSPLCHLKFDDSKGVKVDNITISSPETSLNTDGIHLQNTQDVLIQYSKIGCGDDCVSIQTGCSNVVVHHINCGPGHGISLGGLGKERTVACVSDVIVDNIFMDNTEYGARIKTWQGGLGTVKNVSFTNIHMRDVKVPIIIDQYYCDKGICKNQTEAVAITHVKFDQIYGTYSSQAIHLACSASIPCTSIDLTSIQLQSSAGSEGVKVGLCFNSYGSTDGPLFPSSMDYCLRKGNGIPQRVAKSLEKICGL